MKVAYCIRPDYIELSGGDAVQMLKTKEHVEKLFPAVSISIIVSPNDLTSKYDLIHVFNFSTYTISREFIKKAKDINIPIVTSSIYWDYSYASTSKIFNYIGVFNHVSDALMKVMIPIARLIGLIFAKPVGVSRAFRRNAQWMFDHSDIIAPNSEEEGELLLKMINRTKERKKVEIVYNATDITQNKNNNSIKKEEFLKKYNIPDNYILQAGRIEFCKNQLNLLTSLKKHPEIPIVFVGKVFDVSYFKKLNKLAKKRGNVYFIDAVPYNEMNNFFRYARLHVLLSLRESPGLVNIESLAYECPIVISDQRFMPVNTYFENQPYVVNPLNIISIRNIILKAYNERTINPFNFNKFSWDNVAYQTYNIYIKLYHQKKNK